MRILIDSNIILAAVLWPKGMSAKAYSKATASPNHAIVSDYVIEELKKVFHKKFPDRIDELNEFLTQAILTLEYITVPDIEYPEEKMLRDEKDKPVLRGAIAANADLILTGDRDFLESGLMKPKPINHIDFLGMC